MGKYEMPYMPPRYEDRGFEVWKQISVEEGPKTLDEFYKAFKAVGAIIDPLVMETLKEEDLAISDEKVFDMGVITPQSVSIETETTKFHFDYSVQALLAVRLTIFETLQTCFYHCFPAFGEALYSSMKEITLPNKEKAILMLYGIEENKAQISFVRARHTVLPKQRFAWKVPSF